MSVVHRAILTAMYPHIGIVCNISKQAKLATVLAIEGFDCTAVNDFFGHYCAVDENSAYLASKYFNLPDYDRMLDSFILARNIHAA